VGVGGRVFISGNWLIHQFVRIGRLSLMQGGSCISQDLPPYTIARGKNRICGLNMVGLKRAGLTPEQRQELKRLYHLLFRRGLKQSDALDAARKEFHSEAAKEIIEFVAAGKRGICRDVGGRRETATDE
jgi:UDP-N-acetylglucosamine acyltransferase